MLNEKIKKYFENKKKLFLNMQNNENNLYKSKENLIYKVLKKREQDQFIRKLDKSRSSLNIMKKIPEIQEMIIKPEVNKESNIENKQNNNNDNTNIDKRNNNKNKTAINNKINTNDEKNKTKTIDNNEDKKINKKVIKYIKQSFNEKKVYFNIKIKDIENIKEKNENEDKINEINSNDINENKLTLKENEENINPKKTKKGNRYSVISLKRDNHKLNTNEIIKHVKSSKNIKEQMKNVINSNINEEIEENNDSFINDLNSIDRQENRKITKLSKKKSKKIKNV
jgi:hypothetical protein